MVPNKDHHHNDKVLLTLRTNWKVIIDKGSWPSNDWYFFCGPGHPIFSEFHWKGCHILPLVLPLSEGFNHVQSQWQHMFWGYHWQRLEVHLHLRGGEQEKQNVGICAAWISTWVVCIARNTRTNQQCRIVSWCQMFCTAWSPHVAPSMVRSLRNLHQDSARQHWSRNNDQKKHTVDNAFFWVLCQPWFHRALLQRSYATGFEGHIL